jgi:GT2 family glycosyltransferase
VLGFLCAASMVRRQPFIDVGGFEPRFFLGGEEQLLAIDLAAAGFVLAYIEDVVVHHEPSAQRDSAGRRRSLLRNALWCAWLRRPVTSALRVTATLVLAHRRDPVLRPALRQALGGLPWVLRHRRRVPKEVERELRLLDARWHERCPRSIPWAPLPDFWRSPDSRSTRTPAGSSPGRCSR